MKRFGFLAATLLLASCGKGQSGGKTITIGAVAPWSTGYGTNIHRAIEVAVEKINKDGGINGSLLKVEFKDDSANATRGIATAQEFVADANIVAVIGHANSGVSVASARVYDGHVVAVSPSSSSPDLTGVSPWVFRTINSDSANGIELAKYAMSRGYKRAAMMYENDAFGRGLIETFRKRFDGTIVSVDPISSATRDFEPYVAFYKRVNPDVVFTVGTELSGMAFVKEARKQQLRAELLGADGWSGIVAAGSAVDGVVIGAPFSADSPRPTAVAFVQAYKAKFNAAPDGFSACAYDAVMLVRNAIAAAGPDRGAIRDWLANMKEDYDGVSGAFRLGANGDPIGKALVMTRAKGGALVLESSK